MAEKTDSAPTISVIIPTWNRRDLLRTCLQTLVQQTFSDFEIVVVDDGSTDGTADFLRQFFPGVRLIGLERNSGFAVAVNAGIRTARGEFLFLLNNDMTLEPDFLERMVKAAAESNAALFAPLVLWRDDPERIYSAGDAQRANGRPESIGFRALRAGFALPKEIFGISAGAALYRREVFKRVGLFDETFVAYFEDADLSFRARLAGFDARLVPEAVAYHVGSATLGGNTLMRTRQCFINHGLLVVKDMPFATLVRHAPAIVHERLHQARRLLDAARCEGGIVFAATVFLRALATLVARMPHARAERRLIQRSRVLTPGELERLLWP